MIDAALNNGLLAGFSPLHVLPWDYVVGPYVEAPYSTTVVRRPPSDPRSDPPPAELSRRPAEAEVEAAWAQLDLIYPAILARRGPRDRWRVDA